MNFILFVVMTAGNGNHPVIQTQNFKTEVACLQSIQKIIDVEKKMYLNVKAFCIKD